MEKKKNQRKKKEGCWPKSCTLTTFLKVLQGPCFFHLLETNLSSGQGLPQFYLLSEVVPLKGVKDGGFTLLWHDNWLEGRAPKDIWPNLFNDCNFPWITIRQFVNGLNFHDSFFRSDWSSESSSFFISIPDCISNQEDLYIQKLEVNANFSVRSFYKFLIDGGLRSGLSSMFWHYVCPFKISMFSWLASEDKILTLLITLQIPVSFVIKALSQQITFYLTVNSQLEFGLSSSNPFTYFLGLIQLLRSRDLGLCPQIFNITFFVV